MIITTALQSNLNSLYFWSIIKSRKDFVPLGEHIKFYKSHSLISAVPVVLDEMGKSYIEEASLHPHHTTHMKEKESKMPASKLFTWRVDVFSTTHFPFLCESRSIFAPSSSASSSGFISRI